MKILIDNGHGENTPGKRSPDGTFREYAYTREIADEVVRELAKRGYVAERIVKENLDVPLAERARRVNEICARYGANNVLLVSIHCNDAAACITGQKIRRDYSDGDPDWEENFYILSKTKCPAVLTENFFMDNKEDIAYLTSMEGKQNIVNTHVEGIIQYIKEYEK